MSSYLSQVAEVEVSKEGEVKVRRVVCAVDCGQIVNPDTIVAQIEGGIVFGLSAALWGEITLNARGLTGRRRNSPKLGMPPSSLRLPNRKTTSTQTQANIGADPAVCRHRRSIELSPREGRMSRLRR